MYVGKDLIYGEYQHDALNGNGSTTVFTLSAAPGSVNAVIVSVENVIQPPSAFSLSGTTITFTSAPPVGTSNIRIWHLGRLLDIGDTSAQLLGSAANKAIHWNSQEISENITIDATKNAMSAGPITIHTGYTVTISSGARWVVV